MADLSLSLQVLATQEPENSWRPEQVIEAEQSGVGSYRNTHNITTAGVNISFGDVTPGLVLLYNLDDTNFVDYGENDGGVVKGPGRLYPSTRWPGMFWLRPGATLRLAADTATCKVFIIAYAL